MKGEQTFANYHHVLSQCNWDGIKAVEILIKMILSFTKLGLLLVNVHQSYKINSFTLNSIRIHPIARLIYTRKRFIRDAIHLLVIK